MKSEDFKKLMLKKPKKNKYGAEKTTFMGLKFDSKGEANRYGELVILERMGHIQNLKRCRETFNINTISRQNGAAEQPSTRQ